MQYTTKLCIVGGGPAGLTAAIYAGRANLKPVLVSGGFEGGSMIPGGQLMITTEVENFPGFPDGIDGPDLMVRMMEQAHKFNITEIQEFATGFVFNHSNGSSDSRTRHQITLANGDTILCEAVILAMGAQAKWLKAPNEEVYMNRGISACATCDGPLPMFRDKVILVIGGGDSAMEEATFLTKFGSKVYIVVRRDVLRASKIMLDRVLANPKIEILYNRSIKQYHGTDGTLTGVTLQSTVSDNNWDIECAGVFMAIGHDPCTKHLSDTGIKMDPEGYLEVHDHVYTNIPGVYAAGDIHDIHFKQAITAAGFGCMAAIAAERGLN